MNESDIRVNILDNVSLSTKRTDKPIVITDSILKNPDSFQGLMAHVKVTHAGRLTLNNMVYVPSRVREGLPSFKFPYEKPIGAHHARDRVQQEDPIGRVKKVAYVNTNLPKQFLRDYGDSLNIIEDSNRDIHDAVDIIRRLAKNEFFYDRAFPGFGYVISSGFIPDFEDAKKVADGRYLTVSVRAGSNKALCSICDHDWGASGPCEHEMGEVVDDVRMFLITDKMLYRGYDYVNEPADELASNISVDWLTTEGATTESRTFEQPYNDSIIYELSSSPLLISDSVISSDKFHQYLISQNQPKLINLSNIPKEVRVLAVDAEYGKLTIMTSPDETDGHTHIAEVDLKGNGYTKKGNSPLYDHEHEIVEWQVKEYEDEESGYESRHYIWRQGPIMMIETKDAVEPTDSSVNTTEDTTSIEDTTNTESAAVNNAKDSDTIENVSDSKSKEGSLMQTKQTELNSRLVEIFDSIDADNFNADNFKLSDEDRDLVYTEMSEFLTEDAKLSSEKRQSLPGSAFCGPDRSFPVNDCAHVTAARRLIGRYKGEGSKSSIKSCIERKAKALGCDSEDAVSTEVIDTMKVLQDSFVIDDTVTDDILKNSFSKIEKAMVDRKLKVDVHSSRIQELEDSLSALESTVEVRDEQLKHLRDELRFVYTDSTAINSNVIKADARLRKIVTDVLGLYSKLSGEELSVEDTAKLSTDKLVELYDSKLNALDVDSIVSKVHDGTTVVEDSAPAEDPTLQQNDEADKTKKTVELTKFQQGIFDKTKEIYDSRGQGPTVGYLNTLVGNGIITVDFGKKVLNLLNENQKDAN